MDTLMIGVSGMRGTVGSTLTPAVVTRMASAFVAVLKEMGPPVNGSHYRMVVGRDSRPSGQWLRDCAVGAFTASGVEVIDVDVVSTPGVAMMVCHLAADAGAIVTASHNPIQWNGMKFLSSAGIAFPPQTAQRIKDAYNEGKTSYVPVQKLVPPQRNTQTHALHVKRVLEYVDTLKICSKRFKVVLDSVNGAGCVSGATILGKLGCELVHVNATPDGQFPHEPEPTEANLTGLAAEVRKHKAAIGFAQDPDADRLAIVDENGVYIGEEYSLVLAAKHILGKRRGGVTAANLSSSRMLDDVAAACGARVLRTPVGEANVVHAMIANDSIIGGEGNGGVIDPRIVPGRDSLVGMAYILDLMADTGKTVSQLVAEIPRYQIVKTKFECRREDAERAVEAVKHAFASEKVDTQDGIRIDWPTAWVHARPSNTEPIMRIIAEAPDAQTANEKIAAVRAVVDRALKAKP